MKRYTAIILSIVLILSLCSCNPGESLLDSISDIQAEEETIEPGIDEVGYKLPYDRTDSLNPYEAKGIVNSSLSTLLYDSLYTVDSNFNAVELMAASSSVKETTLTVVLKSNLKFTDGNPVTGRDVVFSFEKAKSSDAYSEYLNNISSAEYNGNTITFNLNHACISEAANLVFPIIEFNSDVSEDSADLVVPAGSGRYYIEDNGSSKILRANLNRLDGYHPKYNMIGLTAVSQSDSVQSLYGLGEIDAYVNDFSDGQFSNYSGTSNDYDMTNLVYLGVNSESESLSSGKVRRAIALLLNRCDLAKISFAGHAVETSMPVHPGYSALNGCTLPTTAYNKDSAINLLEEAGFNQVSSAGIRYSESGTTLEISLLVNKDNSFKLSLARSIQQALKKAGISVSLKEYSYSAYVSAVEEGSYSLYIGEAKLSNNFDLSRFFTDGGSLSYGIDTTTETASTYIKYRSGEATMQNFIDAFADELPIIPIAFRKGITVKSSKLAQDILSTPGDYFSNINEWTVS